MLALSTLCGASLVSDDVPTPNVTHFLKQVSSAIKVHVEMYSWAKHIHVGSINYVYFYFLVLGSMWLQFKIRWNFNKTHQHRRVDIFIQTATAPITTMCTTTTPGSIYTIHYTNTCTIKKDISTLWRWYHGHVYGQIVGRLTGPVTIFPLGVHWTHTHVNQESTEYINQVKLFHIKNKSCSRKNFTANLVKQLFSEKTLKNSNVRGVLGKTQLDPFKL